MDNRAGFCSGTGRL
ncbi:MAG: hypothetical protein ACOYKD_01710 [Anaerolineaceae bacterium]